MSAYLVVDLDIHDTNSMTTTVPRHCRSSPKLAVGLSLWMKLLSNWKAGQPPTR